jgi:DNA-binding HxlR family transcriptional regulator
MTLVRQESIPKILQILSRKYSIQVLELIGAEDTAHWTDLEKVIPRGNLLHLVRDMCKLELIEKLYAPNTRKSIGYRITDSGKLTLSSINKLRNG